MVTDLHIHEDSSYLYAATYGRSIYKIDLSQIILDNNSNIDSSNWLIFPNPASEYVTIQSQSSIEGKISVFNQLGAQLLSENISGNTKELHISNLPKGLYFVTISSENRKVTKKLIVK